MDNDLYPLRARIWDGFVSLLSLAVIGLLIAGFALGGGFEAIGNAAQSVAECPIHITVDYDRHCVSMGVGR